MDFSVAMSLCSLHPVVQLIRVGTPMPNSDSDTPYAWGCYTNADYSGCDSFDGITALWALGARLLNGMDLISWVAGNVLTTKSRQCRCAVSHPGRE